MRFRVLALDSLVSNVFVETRSLDCGVEEGVRSVPTTKVSGDSHGTGGQDL